MTPHGIVRKATFEDAYELRDNIRYLDKRELEEIGNRPILSTLLAGVFLSEPALSLRSHNGDLVGIVGVMRTGLDHGAVWFAGTDKIDELSIPFLRGSKDVLREFDKTYSTLYNVCDARNPIHHRWLKWLGFSFIQRIEQYGPNEVPVYEFARITKKEHDRL